MKKSKAIVSLAVVALLILGFGYMVFYGVGVDKTGSAEGIHLGLDLAGGVSITYQAVGEEAPSAEDMSDTIYKLQQRVENYSTEAQVYKKICGNGGFNAYVGTNDMRDVEKMVNEGDEKADLIRRAFILQMAKDIGSMACVLDGKVDQIIVTGGIAYDKAVVGALKEKCEWIAPFTVYPGEDELLALCQGGLRVITGEEEAMKY